MTSERFGAGCPYASERGCAFAQVRVRSVGRLSMRTEWNRVDDRCGLDLPFSGLPHGACTELPNQQRAPVNRPGYEQRRRYRRDRFGKVNSRMWACDKRLPSASRVNPRDQLSRSAALVSGPS